MTPLRRAKRTERLLRIVGSEPSAVELKQRLESDLKRARGIRIDAQAAGRLTVAQAQVLIAAALSAKDRGIPFRLVATSGPFLASIDELGLSDWIREYLGSTAGPG